MLKNWVKSMKHNKQAARRKTYGFSPRYVGMCVFFCIRPTATVFNPKTTQIQSISVPNFFTDRSPFKQNWRDYLFQFEKRPPSNEGRKTLVLTFVQIESRLKVVDISVQLKCFELYTSETPFSRLPSGTLFGHSTRNRQIELTQVWNFRH